ncbi:beta-L-arabinofuranosidase domain-containing protein [uncultured Psychrobacter sp.]|uniref:beta-L-arabinofuranosidase domain-containing protein n=1 Tax=uncultured Psychrobacter sp. TaxID=259303 RepID=UPI00338D874B
MVPTHFIMKCKCGLSVAQTLTLAIIYFHTIMREKSMPLISRRRFLNQTCLVLGACASSALGTTSAKTSTSLKIQSNLKQFKYAQVQLGESNLRDQFVYQRHLFMNIDDDKLLKPFRQRAGQAAPGEDMGGWYDDSKDFHIDPTNWSTANWHGYIPGHSFGQYISGLARSYAVTGDEKVKQKVAGLVKKYALTISPRFFENYWLPAYTYDKLVIGLIDAFQYTDVNEAKLALDKLTDAVLPFLPEKALTREERRQRPYTGVRSLAYVFVPLGFRPLVRVR